MVYIARDGSVHESPPWSIQRLIGIITGFFSLIAMFFKTMFNMDSSRTSSARDSGGGRGSGGGGGGPPPPGGPRRRPIGRMMTLSDCTIPGGG
ncbi:glycine-rich selenoprotein-like [Armigeres subalbatus]|uniref:glycine-rich selenoprotein-like n=1 Tax=Armigeres subalbatus TaxID=124917 RepID=UPI002ED15C1C